MQASEVSRATDATKSLAAGLGLSADSAIILHNSNRLVVRLMPCDVVARIAPQAHLSGGPELEVEVARRLAETDSPVAALEPRVAPRVYVRDGFAISMWTYYEPVHRDLSPADYAHALELLHAGMRRVNFTPPHFMDRIADTQHWVADREVTPELPGADRELIVNTLRSLSRSILERGAAEQLLHGEPHSWNVLMTKHGPLFVDFENSARAPVEYDLAWVPEEVSKRYRDADQELIGKCRGLVLAIIAAWRWRRDDQHPSNAQREEWLSAFRQGPPWPALDDV